MITSETALDIVFVVLVIAIAWSSYRKMQREKEQINRVLEERVKRQEEAEEKRRAYDESYRKEGNVLRKRVLEDLKAIGRGEKSKLDPESLDAVYALQARCGGWHPKIEEAWVPLIEDLKGQILNARAIHDRLDDLIYPESLEDVDELKQQICNALEKAARGEPLASQDFEAAQAMRVIQERYARKRRKEDEVETLDRRQEKEKDLRFRAELRQMGSNSERNIARIYGLPDDYFNGLSSQETLIRVRIFREMEFVKQSPEEQKRILKAIEERENSREHKQF